MAYAEIIAIGSELLLGGVVDTNSIFLADELLKLGIEVRYKTVVGDIPKDIEEALRAAFARVDLIITTGGLGPTQDDLTRKTVARATRRQLVLHDDALAAITERLMVRHRQISADQSTQALLPLRAQMVANPVGIAPGFCLTHHDRGLLCLPGVPAEIRQMVPGECHEWLESFVSKKGGSMLVRRRLRTFGLAESDVDARLKDLYEAEPHVVIGLQAGDAGVDISITVKARHADSAQSTVKRVERVIRDRMKYFLYAAGSQTMEGVVALQLKARKLTLAVAESCTGGMIAQRLTSIPGSSAYFQRGFVTYSNQAKIDHLKVPEALIRDLGAVSQDVAIAMAEGVREQSGTDLGLSVTGIAGPTGGTKEKPVGLVYWALSDTKHAIAHSHIFGGDRDGIRRRASQAALDLLRRYLSGKPLE